MLFVPIAVGRTAAAVSGLADSELVYRLTRGRLWIAALTALLVGIVALNVLALSFSASSTHVGQEAEALQRQNSTLRGQIAQGLSNNRIQKVAASLGFVVPEPGLIRYLDLSRDDAAVAARRLASGELTYAGTVAPPVSPVVPTTTEPEPATTATQPEPATTDAADATVAADATATDAGAAGRGGGTATAGAIAAP